MMMASKAKQPNVQMVMQAARATWFLGVNRIGNGFRCFNDVIQKEEIVFPRKDELVWG